MGVVHIGNRRVVARGITFYQDKVILIERYRKENNELLHYFTIPGGGVEKHEEFEDACVREFNEETTCDIEILKPLMIEDYGSGICYWFYCKYLAGTPVLGGEEKERNNPDNSFKVVLIPFDEIKDINILGKGKELVLNCIKEYQKKN